MMATEILENCSLRFVNRTGCQNGL